MDRKPSDVGTDYWQRVKDMECEGQMCIFDYLPEPLSYDEFGKYMNKPEGGTDGD